MRRDVELAPFGSVFAQKMEQAERGRSHPRPASIQPFEHSAVAQHDANQRRQVVRAPIARHIRIPCADIAAEHGAAIELRMAHCQRRRQRAFRRNSAERQALCAVNHDNLADREWLDQLQKQPLCEPVELAGR